MVSSGFTPTSPHLSGAKDPRARCSIPCGVSQEWTREAESLSHLLVTSFSMQLRIPSAFWAVSAHWFPVLMGSQHPSRTTELHRLFFTLSKAFNNHLICPQLLLLLDTGQSSGIFGKHISLCSLSHSFLICLIWSLSHSLVPNTPFPCQ